jgi:hypothetical protein
MGRSKPGSKLPCDGLSSARRRASIEFYVSRRTACGSVLTASPCRRAKDRSAAPSHRGLASGLGQGHLYHDRSPVFLPRDSALPPRQPTVLLRADRISIPRPGDRLSGTGRSAHRAKSCGQHVRSSNGDAAAEVEVKVTQRLIIASAASPDHRSWMGAGHAVPRSCHLQLDRRPASTGPAADAGLTKASPRGGVAARAWERPGVELPRHEPPQERTGRLRPLDFSRLTNARWHARQ